MKLFVFFSSEKPWPGRKLRSRCYRSRSVQSECCQISAVPFQSVTFPTWRLCSLVQGTEGYIRNREVPSRQRLVWIRASEKNPSVYCASQKPKPSDFWVVANVWTVVNLDESGFPPPPLLFPCVWAPVAAVRVLWRRQRGRTGLLMALLMCSGWFAGCSNRACWMDNPDLI